MAIGDLASSRCTTRSAPGARKGLAYKAPRGPVHAAPYVAAVKEAGTHGSAPEARPRHDDPAGRAPARRVAMTVFILRRLVQTALVLVVMSVLVFVGCHAIGNPVDILISPMADQADIARAIAALGLDQPLLEQYFVFLRQRAAAATSATPSSTTARRSQLILERMPATLELALARHWRSRSLLGHSARPLGRLKPDSCGRPRRSWRARSSASRLPTFWVGLMLIMLFAVDARLAAVDRPRPDRDAARHSSLELPHLGRPAPPDPAGAQSRAVQALADHPPHARRHARGTAAGLRQVRARQGPVARAASSACTC